ESTGGSFRHRTRAPRYVPSSGGFYDTADRRVQRGRDLEFRTRLIDFCLRRLDPRNEDAVPTERAGGGDVAEVIADAPRPRDSQIERLGCLSVQQRSGFATLAGSGEVRMMRTHIRCIDARAGRVE